LEENNGSCRIEDESPLLSEENYIVLELFDQALRTSNCVAGEDKDFHYVEPTDIEALMNIHNIDIDDKPEIMVRILMLQDISNDQRPNRPKRKGK